MMRRGLLIFFIGGILSSGFAQSPEIENIQLKDLRNKSVSISAKDKSAVIIFMGTDCPITQKYVSRIKEIVGKFSSTTDFYGVFPNQFSIKEIKRFRKDYKLSIHFLRDEKMELAQSLKATVTPEVFLIDAGGQLQYQGAIDNWFYELGKYRLNTTEQYLIDALTALNNGEQPSVKHTEAIGCFIQMSHEMKHH